MCEGLRWSVVTMVSVAVWTSVPCGVWPLVPGPANIHEYEISILSAMLPRLLAADTTQSGVWCPVSGCWLL